MMGAGGFIKTHGWEIFSSDDLMDEDDVYDSVIDNFFNDGDDMELNTEVVLFFPPSDEDLDDDDFDDVDNDDDDYDYVPSSVDEDDFDDDDNILMGLNDNDVIESSFNDVVESSFNDVVESSDDSAPELTN